MDAKLNQVLEAAIARTRGGRLRWSAGSENSYYAMPSSGRLHVARRRPADDGDDDPRGSEYYVLVLDPDGRKVADLEADNGVVATLYDAARASALENRRTLDNMLAELTAK